MALTTIPLEMKAGLVTMHVDMAIKMGLRMAMKMDTKSNVNIVQGLSYNYNIIISSNTRNLLL